MAERKLEDLYRWVNTSLGGTGIEVDLVEEDFAAAFDEALLQYRAHSGGSSKFGWISMKTSPGKQKYILPDDVEDVIDVKRSRSGPVVGDVFEPFSAAFFQSTMQSLGGGGSNSSDLATFEAMGEYQELVGRMFGEFTPFTWNEEDHELYLHRLPRAEEAYGLEVSMYKPVKSLLNNNRAYRWLRSYTEAHCRQILGEKYSKVTVLPGAQGGVQLKGDALKQSAEKMKLALMDEIQNFEEGNEPPMPFIG